MTTQTTITENPSEQTEYSWEAICDVADLVPNSGVCALVHGVQVAIFNFIRLDGEQSIYACDNYDPIGKANVLSRGLICELGGEISICSPLYKQHFSLADGHCFEDESASVNVYPVKVEGSQVYVSVSA